MSEIKRGTTVTVPGVVVCEAHNQRLVELPGGSQSWFATTSLMVQPEPAIKVQDTVQVDGIAAPATVQRVIPREPVYDILFGSGARWCDVLASRLTVIPPKPEPAYHVEYEDDCLNLRLTADDSLQACCEMSEPPAVVDELIELWARNFGIDAAAAQELAAEARVIDYMRPAPTVLLVAIRFNGGWHVMCGGGDWAPETPAAEMPSAMNQYGTVLLEKRAKQFFPKPKGPYKRP